MDDTADIDTIGEQENSSQETSGHDVQKLKENIFEKAYTEEIAADIADALPDREYRAGICCGEPQTAGTKIAAGMADKPVQKSIAERKTGSVQEKGGGSREAGYGESKREGGNAVDIKNS